MIEDVSFLLDQVSLVIIDEAGQSAINQVVALLCNCLQLIKVVLTGDSFQLINFVEDLPEFASSVGYQSALIYLLALKKKAPRNVALVELVTSHRFHPAITQCLSHAVYGESIRPAENCTRDTLTSCPTVPLPNRSCPIVLLHQQELDMRDRESCSRINPFQAEYAAKILRHLERCFPKR